MKVLDENCLNSYDDNEYVWYACYGSNINRDRFMYYINGDETGRFSTTVGCANKEDPVEERKYVFKCPIYFAGLSKRWGGGMAFLDYENAGKSYGKIYKIKMSQFKDVLKQEQKCKLYNAVLLVDIVDGCPVFSFTSKHKLEDRLNQPSDEYVRIIKEGLLELYDMGVEQIREYLKNRIC